LICWTVTVSARVNYVPTTLSFIIYLYFCSLSSPTTTTTTTTTNAFQSSAHLIFVLLPGQLFLVYLHFSAVSTQMALSRLSIQMGFRKQDMQMEESE
jgi:hypothetical protein